MLNTLLGCLILTAIGHLMIKRASIAVWSICYGITAAIIARYGSSGLAVQIMLITGLSLLLACAIKPIRRRFFSYHLFNFVSKILPVMSDTEREALEAGTVGWEGDLFSGSPDFAVLRNMPAVNFTPEEQAFLDGPLNELCRMLDDWDITHSRTDLPEEVWYFIKEHGFLGMVIPKSYGGLEFSATAQLAILTTLYGRSVATATTVSVPNSLGPSELLLKYGTDEQKNYYLPRLANGREIPCFALTGPNAGSDAASIPDKGIVCREMVDGKEVLGIRITWNKRYITLCPVATLVGLAFRLFDPDNLLGKGVDVGITCALIPASTPGVIKGRRHYPLYVAFSNGPTQGKDVFVSMDCLIGGVVMAGHGWRMLMECLSVGRAISLPSSAAGGGQAAALTCGAYARVRKQFNQPIGNFEGIEEPLARIAANAYMIDAGVRMTAAAIDHGAKPPVAGAIIKYHTTERARRIALDAMDIHGGKGICLGPNNYLASLYQSVPISITVEGANILTRSLIIFGQGAIRCHPYVFRQIVSIRENNLSAFDEAIWGHVGFVLSNLTKSIVFAVTDARFTHAPKGPVKRYYQLIHRYSNALALLADFSMMTMGGKLKRKEKLSARLGDLLSHLYMASAVLQRFHQDGEPNSDFPLVNWSCQQLFHECEIAIQGIIANVPQRISRILLKLLLQPLGSQRSKPSDKLGQTVSRLLTVPNEARSRLTRSVFSEALPNCPLGRLEQAFHKLCAVEVLEKKVAVAVKKGMLDSLTLMEQIEESIQHGILTSDEAAQLQAAELARQDVIKVDDFSHEELARSLPESHVPASVLELVNLDE